MIDIHCHILPGLDDGAPDLAASLEMARIAAADGITEVVATPHAFDGAYEVSRARAEAALSDLRAAIAKEGIPLTLHLGSDCHLDPRIFEPAQKSEILTVAGGRYLLIELPHEMVPPRLEDSLFRLRAMGLHPIITHPERNRELQSKGGVDRISKWATSHGLLIQITADSLTGAWGSRAKAMSEELLKAGLCHFVATDAHSPTWRKPVLSEARGVVAKVAGEAAARSAFEENPGRAVRGETITGATAAETSSRARPRGFAFWRS